MAKPGHLVPQRAGSVGRVRAGAIRIDAGIEQLTRLGIEEQRYREMLYDRTQEVAAAAAFMGFDGILAPSARSNCQNVMPFLDARPR